ncbi:hypothetical protein E3O55_19020 [Cryobacterium sp. MDB1-18-2]|nr:hypothetical protein E3O55_19020 [Cryobacterium sp. MDB1-18-2]TFC40689.1 hypothetical protein E3O50_12815 [Cryobacterium sp. MDB1-18-1]
MDPRRGFDRSTEFPLTVGRDYPVFAITVFLGSAWYYILNDDGHDWPTSTPSALFDVTDGSLPASWIVGYNRFTVEEQFPLISFPEWADDRGFYERLLDREPNAVQVFTARRREVEEAGL